jgi:hypothetical protein
MTEEKKGHARITVDVEINEELLGVIKEGMSNMSKMHWKMPEMMKSGEGK